MTDVRSAWKDAGERFAALGASLKAHYDQQRDDDAESTKKELNDAAKRFAGAIQDAVEALGAAAKDPTVKSDVRNVGTSLAGALSATFSEVSEDLRRMAERQQAGKAGAEPPAGTTAPPPTASTTSEPSSGTTSATTSEETSAATSEGDEPPKVEPWGTP